MRAEAGLKRHIILQSEKKDQKCSIFNRLNGLMSVRFHWEHRLGYRGFRLLWIVALAAALAACQGVENETVKTKGEQPQAVVETPQSGVTEEALGTGKASFIRLPIDGPNALSVPGSSTEAEGACGTDEKLACPLVKPVEPMTVKYNRTPEQIARMEAFDALTLEEKFHALDQGLIVCTEFIHDAAWEHQMDPILIAIVGQDKFDQWINSSEGCHSIYDFAKAFALTYDDLEKAIVENSLIDIYDLAALKAGMEKWTA